MKNYLKNEFKDKYFLTLLLLALISVFFLNPMVRGDGVGYYAYVRSAIIDKDLEFRNEFESGNRDVIDHISKIPDKMLTTETGKFINQFSVGPSILWSPFFLAAHAFVKFVNLFGSTVKADGYSLPYLFAISFGTYLYALIGLLISYTLARRYYGQKTAFTATVAVWFASSLPVYMYFQPYWSHCHSMFTVGLLMLIFVRLIEKGSKIRYFLLGLISGLMIIVYYVNAVFLVFSFVVFLNEIKNKALKTFSIYLPLYLLGFALTVSPHFIVKKLVYGSAFTTGYEWITWYWLKPKVFKVLFSSFHGLFSWTPVLIFSVLGWLFLSRKNKTLGFTALVVWAVFLYVIASFFRWHGISSFGNRFFISFTPLFIVGLAACIDFSLKHMKRIYVNIAVSVLIVWNFGFIYQWGTGLIERRAPIKWSRMIGNQFIEVPKNGFKTFKRYFTDRKKLKREIENYDRKNLQWDSDNNDL